MGCCFSRSAGPNSPYPGGAPESSRAIAPAAAADQQQQQSAAHQSPALSGPAAAAAASSSSSPNPQQQQQQQNRRHRRREPRPLDQHINKPLRPEEWVSRDRGWSRRQLARERRDFFHTRVTGRPEIWQTIHAALQVLWEAQGRDGGDDEGGEEEEEEEGSASPLETAQTLLNAADISLPTGLLSNGVYDSLGNYYALPQHIVCDPVDVIDDALDEDAKGGGDGEDTTAEDDEFDDDDDDDDDDDVVKSGREGKGKGVVAVTEKITVKARLSENGLDYEVLVGKTDSVRSISRKIADKASLPPTKKIRIAYMGKILKDNLSLEAQGWQQGHVLNALVFFQKM